MAETKAKPKSKSKAKAKSAKSKAKSAGSKNGSAKSSGSKSSGSPSAKKTSTNGKGNGASQSSASSNGHANGVAPVVEKAKLPLIATGAVLAGAAAVVVGKNTVGNGHKKKVLGVPVPKRSKSHLPKVGMPKVGVPKVGLPKGKGLKGDVRKAAGAVTDAARQADQIGKRISKVANSVQAVSETTDQAAKKS